MNQSRGLALPGPGLVLVMAAGACLGGCYVSASYEGDAVGDPGLPDVIDALPDADGPRDALDADSSDFPTDSAPTHGWVAVPAGTFTMGAPTTEPGWPYGGHEQIEVTLTHDFEIQATEVTQAQFVSLMGYDPSHFNSCGDGCPVESLTWHEAAAYTNAMSAAAWLPACYVCTGSGSTVACEMSEAYHASLYDCPGYRLPTSAEWEYAARAGTTGGTYNGTSTLLSCESPNAVLDPIAWFCGDSGDVTHASGLKMPNAWGLYDMLGNVWEWCHDWYNRYDGPVTNPWGARTGTVRMKRGGAWGETARTIRAAFQDGFGPDMPSNMIGFRPARTLD